MVVRMFEMWQPFHNQPYKSGTVSQWPFRDLAQAENKHDENKSRGICENADFEKYLCSNLQSSATALQNAAKNRYRCT
jgi:hypothetical protein